MRDVVLALSYILVVGLKNALNITLILRANF